MAADEEDASRERDVSDAEPEEESDLDAGQTSDSSPLKSGSSAASGSGGMLDRKRGSTFLMAYAGANGSLNGGDALDESSVVSASAYWKDGVPPDSIDATRALYELQYQMKRPAAILRMKSNSVSSTNGPVLSRLYGFKTNSTFDTLVALTSPLRQPQVLDDWTALEIAIFEESFEKFGRKFHLIADQLPGKTAKDVIALFYVWKRHGSCAKYHDFDDEDDYVPTQDLPSETKYMVEQLKRRQACTKAYINAARCLFVPRTAPASNHKRAKISDFGLQGVPAFRSAVHGTSLLRSISALDSWTPIEIRVFEVAIECYGKDFHKVAHVIGTKTCRETIALYYIWKKDPHYQTVKNRWGKNEVSQSRKDFVASSHHPAAVPSEAS